MRNTRPAVPCNVGEDTSSDLIAATFWCLTLFQIRFWRLPIILSGVVQEDPSKGEDWGDRVGYRGHAAAPPLSIFVLLTHAATWWRHQTARWRGRQSPLNQTTPRQSTPSQTVGSKTTNGWAITSWSWMEAQSEVLLIGPEAKKALTGIGPKY